MEARKALLLGSLLIAGPAVGEISYNYVDFGYGVTSVDVAAPLDGDGFGPQAFASYQFFGPFIAFIGADYRDFSDDNLELNNLETGFGWNRSLSDNSSAFLQVAYLYTDVDLAGSQGFDQDGYGATLGYRAENQTPWEFIATLDYVNVESGVDMGGSISLVYDAWRQIGITGGFSYFDDSTQAFLGVRYFFDHRH